MLVAGKRECAAGSVGVGPREGNVVLLADDAKPEDRESCDDAFSWSVDRELRDSDCHARFGDKGLDDGVVRLELGRTDRFDVESDGRANVVQGVLICVALAENNPLEPNGIGHVRVGMLLHDDLHVRSHDVEMMPLTLGRAQPWASAASEVRCPSVRLGGYRG